MSPSTTAAPSDAISSAQPKPMPCAAPVTTTTLPERRPLIVAPPRAALLLMAISLAAMAAPQLPGILLQVLISLGAIQVVGGFTGRGARSKRFLSRRLFLPWNC